MTEETKEESTTPKKVKLYRDFNSVWRLNGGNAAESGLGWTKREQAIEFCKLTGYEVENPEE